ncbi:zinc finger BED domain-containing protein RICESLEEPER 2-like [Panicum virgatum]|uniref:zinc finger BED domain-containing protein RICESLEEPER 2-like n=1 Tax=Panicum virgatum TaxID=38727 RepID=UPI0019D61C1A|nr:zinc finger BED domain-containing protein RICESLEEPER 2-like [Panicum virgatum]
MCSEPGRGHQRGSREGVARLARGPGSCAPRPASARQVPPPAGLPIAVAQVHEGPEQGRSSAEGAGWEISSKCYRKQTTEEANHIGSLDRVVRPAPNGRRTRCRRKRRRGIQQETPAEAGTEQEEAPVEAGTEQEVPAGTEQEVPAGTGTEQEASAKTVPLATAVPATVKKKWNLPEMPGHRTLAGDAAGHEPRGTRSLAPSCSRPPPPKQMLLSPDILYPAVTSTPVLQSLRRTITDDCSKKYQEEKQVLLDVLKNVKGRVSLTMDMWTSNQTLGYMCITCHFTDDDWKMHNRTLKFSFMKTPHTDVAMFNAVLRFLQEWNIEDKLFAVTLDNASNNNAMMKLLKSNLLEKKILLGKGKLLHQRCAAHVLNLICKAGLEIINPIVHKIRESVKYVQGSTSQKQKFEEIIQQLSLSCEKRPKVDTCTCWNSTYLMLKISFKLRRAFDSLGQQNQEYTFAPTSEEWEKSRKVRKLLKIFFAATTVVSGTLYLTANLHFHEIWEIRLVLENQVPEADAELAETIQYMQRKFRRYWKLTWLQIAFPVIFDPRFKLKFIDIRLKQAFGSDAEAKIEIVKKTLLEIVKKQHKLLVLQYRQMQVEDMLIGITMSISIPNLPMRYLLS